VWQLALGGHRVSLSNPKVSTNRRRLGMFKSFSKMKKRDIIGALVLAWLTIATTPGVAFDKVNKSDDGVAIKGYDSVAYHTEGRAVKGRTQFSYKWNDAEWHFASAENRDLFAASPDRFAPQYGGY